MMKPDVIQALDVVALVSDTVSSRRGSLMVPVVCVRWRRSGIFILYRPLDVFLDDHLVARGAAGTAARLCGICSGPVPTPVVSGAFISIRGDHLDGDAHLVSRVLELLLVIGVEVRVHLLRVS